MRIDPFPTDEETAPEMRGRYKGRQVGLTRGTGDDQKSSRLDRRQLGEEVLETCARVIGRQGELRCCVR